MKKILGMTVIFGAGVAVGSLITFKKMESSMNAIIDREVEEVKAYYFDKYTKHKIHDEIDEDDMSEVDDFTSSLNIGPKGQHSSNTDYTVFYETTANKKSIEEEMKERGLSEYEEDEDDEEKYMIHRSIFEERRAPYIIPQDEFGIMDGFETLSVTYYVDAGVLVDERDEPIDYVADLIGDALRSFGDEPVMSDDVDILYVRNEVMMSDIEVIRTDEDYADILIRSAMERESEKYPTTESMSGNRPRK